MKKLLITLILVSPLSFADWGDVYYCQITSLVDTVIDGTVTQYKLQKFQFKLDEEKKSMVFGQSGYFNNSVKPLLDDGSAFPSQEAWWAGDSFSILKYRKGKFLYAAIGKDVTSISANCDKF